MPLSTLIATGVVTFVICFIFFSAMSIPLFASKSDLAWCLVILILIDAVVLALFFSTLVSITEFLWLLGTSLLSIIIALLVCDLYSKFGLPRLVLPQLVVNLLTIVAVVSVVVIVVLALFGPQIQTLLIRVNLKEYFPLLR